MENNNSYSFVFCLFHSFLQKNTFFKIKKYPDNIVRLDIVINNMNDK